MPLFSVSVCPVTVMLTGPSEGGNERFAAEVIAKGMKPLLPGALGGGGSLSALPLRS